MGKEYYRLRIKSMYPINEAELNAVLGLQGEVGRYGKSKNDSTSWDYEIAVEQSGWFVDYFYKILKGKQAVMESIGIDDDSLTVWWLKEYDQQCNLELSLEDMKKLLEVNLSVAISCWQSESGTELSNGV